MIYNHCDVLLLAEAYYLYRKVILHSFKLDPSHFYGTPTLAFNIMLKYSKCQLEHLSDSNINDFLEHLLEEASDLIRNDMKKETPNLQMK